MSQSPDLALQTKQEYPLVATDFGQVGVSRVADIANLCHTGVWLRV
jgi:hypothetical protein